MLDDGPEGESGKELQAAEDKDYARQQAELMQHSTPVSSGRIHERREKELRQNHCAFRPMEEQLAPTLAFVVQKIADELELGVQGDAVAYLSAAPQKVQTAY